MSWSFHKLASLLDTSVPGWAICWLLEIGQGGSTNTLLPWILANEDKEGLSPLSAPLLQPGLGILMVIGTGQLKPF